VYKITSDHPWLNLTICVFGVSGASKKNGEMLSILQQLRASTIVGGFFGMDENIQVNGYVFIQDWTGVTAKHLTRWNFEDMRNWHNCVQVIL